MLAPASSSILLVSKSKMNEILERVWDNLIGRGSGPMDFRLIMQPAVATFIAIRAGLKDAREGQPPFFWAALTNPAYRPKLLRQGWKDVGKVFILASVLDLIYQLIVHRGVYVGELLIMASLLAIVPYVLVRGPVNRIARRKLKPRQDTKRTKAA
jgi:hypothetical protein